MAKPDIVDVIMHVTHLRSSPEYQKSFRLLRRSCKNSDDMAKLARGDKNSDEYAALRLLIGSWERIAIIFNNYSKAQRYGVFKCHPVSLVWSFLEPAIGEIRKSNGGDKFASAFEDLHEEYQAWTKTSGGKDFRSAEQQVICALFA